MRFNVLFFKRKHLYYAGLITLVLIFFIFYISSKNNIVSSTFTVNLNNKSYKADFTGDGKEDILYITTNKDKYHLQVNTEKDSIYLEPSKKLPIVGNFYPYWTMRVKLIDISRDKVPEIFIQSSYKNKPIQHMFVYNNNTFKDIFCSYNNILGFVDCTNNATPKIISGKISNGNLEFCRYIFLQNKLEQYSEQTSNIFMGKDTIMFFINLITTLSKDYKPTSENLFVPHISSNSLALIEALANTDSTYIFQDATFMDTKSYKNGTPSQVEWILNFRGISKQPQNTVKNYTLKLNLKAFNNSKEKFHFKINSISLIK
nr:VCBS repeat-containing protein [Clostridium aestuarii]